MVVTVVIYVSHNRTPNIVIPTPAMPAVNAYNDFVLAGQIAGGMQHKTPYDSLSQFQQQLSTAYLTAFHKDAAPVLAVLRGGLSKPYLNPPERSLRSLTFLQWARFRELARIIAGEALYYQRVRQPDRAVNVLLDGLEMGVMIPRGGGLNPGLVGLACDSICTHDFEPLLPPLSPAELAQVAARLDRIDAKRTSFADVLAEEANSQIAMDMEALRDSTGIKIFALSRS
ncbi:MAG TPA: hypothetical protein VKT32_01570 [Chthonomonadaceae bacterium]|nr:hypothetical protein [Chthonomonadaceae bacterium]